MEYLNNLNFGCSISKAVTRNTCTVQCY